MEPKNEGWEHDFHFQKGDFQVQNVTFSGSKKERVGPFMWISC